MAAYLLSFVLSLTVLIAWYLLLFDICCVNYSLSKLTANRVPSRRFVLKNRTIYLAFVFMLLLSGAGAAAAELIENQFYSNKMAKNINSAGHWIIREGVHRFSEGGKQAIHRKLVDDWGVQIWVDPWIETQRYLAQFRIKARGIHYDIHNLYREKAGDDFYEFWLIKVAAKTWSGERARSMFFVAKTQDIYGKRTIVQQSDQFIESHSVGDRLIRLPLNNMELLYDMQAWLFPQNYKNSDLNHKPVVMDNQGNITFAQPQ